MPVTAIVVGAGVTGLATAHALSRRGVAVAVLERGPLPNPIASSFDRHRLIRPHYPASTVYTRRIREAFAAWDALWAEIGTSHYVETGVLSVSLGAGDWTDRARTAMDAVAEPYEVVDPATFAARYPHFAIPDMGYALLTVRGGALLADRILASYIDLLRGRGVTLLDHAAVVRVDPGATAVHLADGRAMAADLVVVAPGVGAIDLFAGHVAVPLVPKRSVLLYVEPPAAHAASWRTSPAWVDLGGDDEYWGIPSVAGIPIKLGLGAVAPDGDPNGDRFTRDSEIRAVFEGYRLRLRDIDDYRLVEGHANWWTLAPDERFLFAKHGATGFLSACSGHGFKFGVLTGEDVARAMLGEEDSSVVAHRLAGLEAVAA